MAADAPVPPADARASVRAASRALVTLLFVLVPLSCLPTSGDPFILPKWHVLDALALLLLLVELALPWREAPWPWPRLAAAAGLSLVCVVRLAPHGWAWLSPILLDRGVALLLPLLFWRAARRGDLLAPMRRGLFASVAIVATVVLLQAGGVDPLGRIEGGDHRSATFGNVNLAAEFLGLGALALLTLGRPRPDRGGRTEIVTGVALGTVLILGTRSVLLGLLAGAFLLATRRTISRAALARIGAGGVAVASILLLVSSFRDSTHGGGFEGILPSSGHLLSGSGRAHKQASAELRLGAWKGTLLLLGDEPWGHGALAFEHAFIPYQLATSPSPNEAFWFRSPHNELLRLGVEHGLPVAVLLLLLLVPLPLCALRAAGPTREGPWLLAGGALLTTQCLFQFPLETGCGALFATLWFALLLDATGPAVALPRLRAVKCVGAAAAMVAAGLGAMALYRSARANAVLGEARGERWATQESCELEPRNLGVCVTAAWLDSANGKPEEALHLTEVILRHSPHYYPAIKLLGELRVAGGENDSGCQDLALYERLFGGRGLASRIIDRQCARDTRARSRNVVRSLFWSSYPGLSREPDQRD